MVAQVVSIKALLRQWRWLFKLVPFSFVLIFSCKPERSREIQLIYEQKKPTAISIPIAIVKDFSPRDYRRIAVRLASIGQPVEMLGEWSTQDDAIVFTPIVPFTRGLHYQVVNDLVVIGDFSVPLDNTISSPALLHIYPSGDTVPENLLKVYLQFSKPMREGQSLSYINLLNDADDTVAGVFLDLQPELWNDDGTILTIWLDPGRIKRGLQPNMAQGVPLQNGENYTLTISDRWKDTDGAMMAQHYRKTFTVSTRDSVKVDPKAWDLTAPKIGTVQALMVNLKSPHDYSLISAALSIRDVKGAWVSGKWEVGQEEKHVAFVPENDWTKGTYRLSVETRLEDLAGNNVNRSFDRNISIENNAVSSDRVIDVEFTTIP